MNSNGQGALEYLLLIGGAVLIATVAIVMVTSSASSGKNVAQNAQNSYSTDITGLQTVAGLKIYGSETVTPIQTGCFEPIESVTKRTTGIPGAPQGYPSALVGFPDATCEGNQPGKPACFLICTSGPTSSMLFKVPTKSGTRYKITLKVADYNGGCNAGNVLDLTFFVNGVHITDPPTVNPWKGNSAGGNPFGGWAYPSITFTAAGLITDIVVQNNYDYFIGYSFPNTVVPGCSDDLNLILNWLKLETA